MAMRKVRVFEDLLTLEVYLLDTRRSSNGIDTVETFEVNGQLIELTVSGNAIHYLERLRSDLFHGHNGKRFFTEEERTTKETELNKEHKFMRQALAGMIYDNWRKLQKHEP